MTQDTKQNYLSEIEVLREELHAAQCEATNAHKLRKECTELCHILTVRLQELAEFLDSLLRQKDMLSVLGQDRRRAMRNAVDKSLDLSKSLNNMSMSFAAANTSRLSLSDTTSFMHQLSFLSADLLLSDDKENLTADDPKAEMIETLRTEIKHLKKELEKSNAPATAAAAKKERKSLPAVYQHQLLREVNSESEAWSEPDRKVSIARIGLDESSIRSTTAAANISRSPKKYNITETTTASSNTSSDLESGGGGGGGTKLTRKNSNSKYQARIAEVELKLSQRDNDILKQQCQLVESDNRLKTERLRVFEISKELDDIRELNAMLEVDIATFKARVAEQTDRVTELSAAVAAKDEAIERLTAVRDASDVDLRVATMKLEALQSEMCDTRRQHGEEVDKIMTEHSAAIELVKRGLLDKHRSELERNWVSRVQHEDVRRQAETVGRHVADAQATIDFMRENESELNAQIIDGEKGIRALRKQLDDAAMQTSKAVLERTKVMAEKLMMEKQCVELQQQLDGTLAERAELVARMAQLEKLNATLQNRLVTNGSTAAGGGGGTATTMQYQLSRSASQGSGGHYYQPMIQRGGGSHSSGGYTSDEVVVVVGVNKERLQNSSPDLGIESDAGRTSNSDGCAVVAASGSGTNRVQQHHDLGASMSNVFIEDEEDSKFISFF